MPSARVPFTKLSGTGNEFVLVDTLRHPREAIGRRWPSVAKMLCDRRDGVGADGLLVLGRSRTADVRMRIFNPDGTEPSMCGNGIRCLAWYVTRHGQRKGSLAIETRAGVRQAQVCSEGRVRINMGVPRVLERFPRLWVGGRSFPNAVLIDSGVPHLVCWVDDVARIDVETLGRRLRLLPRFAPEGANVDFVEDGDHRSHGVAPRRIQLKMRTYERGVEGETRACGTGAVAVASAAVQAALLRTASGRTEAGQFEVEVRVAGGRLRVSLGAIRVSEGNSNRRVVFSSAFLEGEARQVSRGTVTWTGRRS